MAVWYSNSIAKAFRAASVFWISRADGRNGKVYTYYYWNPGRGTDRQGERIKLPNAADGLSAR